MAHVESNDPLEHDGRIAVITGGGRGFGTAFGHALARRGAVVVLADIDEPAAIDAAAAISATGATAVPFGCDVNDEQQVGAMVAELAARYGGIDILINNAGLHSQTYNEPMANSGVDKLRRLFDVNVMGTIICTLAAAPLMKGRPGASIVNISSAAADACQTAYGISKLAVRGVTVTTARELGPDGIRVNAIAPGLIFTDTIRAELPPAVVDVVKRTQVIDVEGEEVDVVEAMLYLVSERARFVTAETLRVGGGLSIHV
jgi:3-oxoacyl-[acyl-carrier protein] reductase